MGIFSKFEDKMEDTVEGAASRMSKAPISPVQIAKKAEKQMRRETMVGAGKQYAPTLYTVLVNPDDDERLFGYYPTLAGETETYLRAKAAQEGLAMDGNPLVRFIVDDNLRHGKFDVIAEVVAAPIVSQLRDEEMERYGIAPQPGSGRASAPLAYDARASQGQGQGAAGAAGAAGRANSQPVYGYSAYAGHGQQSAPHRRDAYDARDPRDAQGQGQGRGQGKPPLPYVPEDEIDRSIDYGEYTFNSADFEDYREHDPAAAGAPLAYNDAARANSQPLAGAAGAAAASAAGTASGSAPAGRQRQQYQPSSTIAFAGAGAGSHSNPIPDRHAVCACLVEIATRRSYDLAGTRITIGRETGNGITVADINASRRHAELVLNQQGLWVIADLNSMNGTLVNGVSVASQPLYPGDVVTIGKTDFEFALV